MLGLTVTYFLLQMIGVLGHAAHAHVGHGGGGHGGSGHGHDAHHDADHQADHGLWDDVLGFFGIGRVPFMVVWLTLFIFAGFTGLFLNWLYVRDRGSYPAWFFLISIASAI